MKRNRLILLALMLIGLLNAQKVCAWSGSTPAAIASATTDDEVKFYLYNVGTGQFLTQGGNWGTSAVVANDGMRFDKLEDNNDGTYCFRTSLGATRYMFLSTGDNTKNPYYLYLDQNKSDVYNFTVSEVSEGTKVYTIKATLESDAKGMQAGTYYISVDENKDCKAITANDNTCNWMFVTLKEIKDNFANTNGTEANPAFAPHLIYDAGFYRENGTISNWKMVTGQDEDTKEYTTKSLANYYYYTSNGGETFLGDTKDNSNNDYKDGIKPTDATKIVPVPAVYTYTVACYRNQYSPIPNHTRTITSETPLDGITTEVGKSTTITSSDDFLSCGTNHGNTTYHHQIVTLSSYTPATTTGGYTYYVGNGYNMYQTSGTLTFEDNNTYTDSYYQEPFGGYWTANIHGTTGAISQQITPARIGWWKVTAKGFSNDGKGYLFAYADGTGQTNTDKYQVQPFDVVDIETEGIDTYVKASKYLNTTSSQAVTVYVSSETETLTFGGCIQNGASDSWACFDDFTLSYLGTGELNLILDEENEKLDYINGQVNTEKNQTLRLLRSFKTDKWNSLVLPVKLTAQQVKTAFGTGTKLSKLDRTELDGKRIFFEKVDLSVDDNEAIAAGQLYIIKPQNAIPTDQDAKTRKITVGEEEIEITTDVNNDTKSDYYTINQVAFTAAVEETVETDVVGSEEDAGIKMVGTYLYKKATGTDHSIPANSYILSDGIWYYHTAGVHNVKGLRGWIQTNQATAETKFFINGVEEGEATAIEGIENSMEVSRKRNSNIYNLNGQLVRSNSTSAEGLDKGIYIIGGKKVVVK